MARKSKKPKIKKLQINLTNRWLYTLIVFFSLVVVGVFVYATTPNPGHDITQIGEPDGCGNNQFLKWTGSSWTCEAVSDEVGIGGSGTANYIPKFTAATTVGNSVIYETAGKVGIGTTSPGAPLHTKGTGATSSTGSCEGTPHSCGAHSGDDSGCGAAGCIYNYGNGVCSGTHIPCSSYGSSSTCASHGCTWTGVIRYTSKAAIFEAGNVGIGDTAPVYALELPNLADYRGRGRANQWAIYSSIRWKENIIPIDSALDKIIQLQGVYFDWKPEYGGSHGIGLIAEDVGKIIPEVVDWEDDGIYARSLDYDHLTALLVEAIKEQQQEIENLKQDIEALKTI